MAAAIVLARDAASSFLPAIRTAVAAATDAHEMRPQVACSF